MTQQSPQGGGHSDQVTAIAPKGLPRIPFMIGAALAVLLAIHAIVVAYAGQYVHPEYIRAGALFACAVVVVCTSPLAAATREKTGLRSAALWGIDLLLLANLGYASLNFLNKIADIENLIVEFSLVDQATALIAILSLLEFTRRVFGPVLAATGLIALIYCLFGQDLPGFLRHSGFSLELTMEIIWFGFQGVFGFATGIVVLLIFIFIVFGALLEGGGAGGVMIRMALVATGSTRGGPAHAAIIASSIFGMSSGSVTANVVGTGAVTIPLIKRRGFSGAFAGAVEAAASTGGQVTPPVMGAAAFLMTQLAGVPYQTICIAALVPAILYYFSLFVSVGQEAGRLGLEPAAKHDKLRLEPGDGVKSLMFFVPLAAILLTLAMGRSPSMAGFWAATSTIAMSFILNPQMRRDPKILLSALAKGGIAGARIMMAVGAIGVMIAVFELTGVGLKFATQVALIGDTSLFVALLLAAAACLVLGMGMPTLPAYLIIVLVLGNALKKLGIPDIAVHLFVFYFGVLSAITPPVALAAVAAAPIAGAEPMKTGLTALRLSLVGFVVPFIFIYEPALLLVVDGFQLTAFIWVLVRLLLAIWLLNSAFSGFDGRKLSLWSRVIRLLVSVPMFIAIPEVKIIGFVAGLAVVFFDRLFTPPQKTAA